MPYSQRNSQHQQEQEQQRNVCRPCGTSRSECGYCHGSRWHVLSQTTDDSNNNTPIVVDKASTSESYHVLLDSLTVEMYVTLINRGWRRSGNLLYRPHNWNVCCPLIPIRLDVHQFKTSKSQRRAWKQFQRIFATTKYTSTRHGMDIPIQSSASSSTMTLACLKQKLEKRLIQMGILKQLQQTTCDIIRNKILSPSKDASLNLSPSRLETLCSFKLIHCAIIEPDTTTATTLTKRSTYPCILSTSIGPALQGLSGGILSKAFIAHLVVTQWNNNNNNSNMYRGDNPSWVLQNIKHEEKSGQVHITGVLFISNDNRHDIDIDDDDDGKPCSSSTLDADMNHHLSSKKQEMEEEDRVDDVIQTIQNFITQYSTYYHTTTTNNDDDSKQDHSQNPLISQPSFQLCVYSVPAYKSCRQVEVHQLFARYQAAIHGDVNPYHVQQQQEQQQDQQQEQQNEDVRESKKRPMEEEEDTSVFNPENPTSNGQEEEEEDDDDNESISSQTDNAMLTQADFITLFPHYSMDQIKNIWKSYVSFKRFLCDSPFENDTRTMDDTNLYEMDKDGYDIRIPYGCYHQQYYIVQGGRKYLFAVTVVDILPTCLSSVYSFFDPILSKTLQLGKITALREIEWVQRAQVYRPELKYYYLGYYVKSCPKMSYKAEYKPSFLLCPTYGTWVDFEQANQRLEKYSPVRNICTLMVNDDDDGSYKHPPKVYTLNGFDIAKDMKIDIGSGNVSLNQLNELGRNLLLPIVKEFVDEVGEDIAGSCIIKL